MKKISKKSYDAITDMAKNALAPYGIVIIDKKTTRLQVMSRARQFGKTYSGMSDYIEKFMEKYYEDKKENL